jgi:hypothetical protein
LLVTEEAIGFEKQPVEVQDFRNITTILEEFQEYTSNQSGKPKDVNM